MTHRPEGGQPPADDSAGSPKLLASGYQGAVYLVQSPGGPLIIKRAMGRGLVRAARTAMLRREHGIYRLLAGVRGVPRCHGLRRGRDLVLEYVPGRSLRDAQLTPAERTRFCAALLALIESVHRAGVAHGDLKRKDNILVGPDGQPYLIDFGTAVSAPPGAGALRRWLFRQVRRIDLNAWIKLKYRRRLADIEPGDLPYYRPTLLERAARLVRRAWRKITRRGRRTRHR